MEKYLSKMEIPRKSKVQMCIRDRDQSALSGTTEGLHPVRKEIKFQRGRFKTVLSDF